LYYSNILKKAFEKVNDEISKLKKSDEEFFRVFFSLDLFNTSKDYADLNLYLPNDGDILYILKKFSKTIPEAGEFLFRKPLKKPLWKTNSELKCLFPNADTNELLNLKKYAEDDLFKVLKVDKEQILAIFAIPKVSVLNPKDLKISVRNRTMSYTDVTFDALNQTEQSMCFYVYIPSFLYQEQKEKAISTLQNQISK
jgi:hypothetical protein